ncbi:hypothetical protein B0T14DRAFT_416357 [Immersiella caudata]|uniref:Uncharacterized protein n=1 Tax=Immersiella caudata TaxID=314043 RepID=A0AA39XG02_9PEZI|nr:hypothetical protein B0T14DRAFT_416357 [Immersiella caudata]
MKRDACESPFSLHNAPYNFVLATAASTSSGSIWSDSSSQHSDDSNSSSASDSDSCDSYCFSQPAPSSSQSSVSSVESASEPIAKLLDHQPKQGLQTQSELPQELRQNPRRNRRRVDSFRAPPTLVRQTERKHNFVDNLVDSSAHIVEAIWPTSSVVARNEHGENAVLPLRKFIQETLRRSRTSFSTLQVALYYLILIKPHVPDRDFTMEQPDDCHASQAVQCGRRMFLAALILASKYLQDRNFSARAWSKISGLDTHEINRNEIIFLLAVNWKLHITDEIYNRWLECVNKFQPPPPPTPGELGQQIYERRCAEFRAVILTLTPELDNLEALDMLSPYQETVSRALYTPTSERSCAFGFDSEVAPTPKTRQSAPAVMEPSPATVYTPGRCAPALGLLPTPRLTPQTSGFSTPAVSAASYLLSSKGSMGLAMAQASAAQSLDRWPPSTSSSPQSYFTRRSSLANSVSAASSPESMVSDSSRLSRSSSISSASSVSAPSAKLDVLARCRYAKLCSERLNMKPAFAPVPEDYQVECLVASPESYTGPVGDSYARNRREQEMTEAAWALQKLQTYGAGKQPAVPVRTGSKRGRTASIDSGSLQENVRELLGSRCPSGEPAWSDSLVRGLPQQIPVSAPLKSNKRLCCSTEAAEPFMMSSLHPAMGGVGGPGMWANIL